MEFVIFLNGKGSIKPKLVGGKAASLQKLIRFGHNVPSGFVLTAHAFTRFSAKNDFNKRIKTELRGIRSAEGRVRASASIQTMIMGGTIPSLISDEINVGIERLTGRRFAVRSSARVEDGKRHSWAGQFDSYLDVEKRDITKYVQKCWASFFNSRAISYQPEAYSKVENLGIAVIVQKMVPSDFAGVIFSTDPREAGSRSMLLEAVAGHGDGLVSGKKQSFAAALDKRSGHMISNSFPNQNSDLPPLSTFQIKLLYRQAIQVEQEFGTPVDIEWAFAKNELFLLQARPITAFSGGLR
jgi:pyruvate,water dikinase